MTILSMKNSSFGPSMSPTSATAEAPPNFDALLPSILQCFSIILAGFFSRKINLITEAETKGIRMLLVYFLTPAMMGQCLLLVEWKEVNWKFLACGFVAKSFVFVGVAASTLILSNDLCKAGIYAIFSTQSNDMALGYPLAKALYSHVHADYPRYIYLLMPVSLLILNPIGFFVMEVEKRKLQALSRTGGGDGNANRRPDQGLGNIVLNVFRGLISNPMVISTVIGLIGNLIVRHVALPNVIYVVLEGFSSGFVPVALFALGCTLVSNENKADLHCPFATVLILTLAKILLLPLLLRELISLCQIGENSADTSSLSTFGFLYGCLPTAPTVFVYASQYSVAEHQIAFGLALCTFLSAPWLYFSCRMISVHHMSTAQQENVLNFTTLHANIVGLVVSIFGIVIFVLTRKFRRLPHRFVFCFLTTSMFLNIFVITWLERSEDGHWWLYRVVCVFLIYYGQWSLRVWTVVLAISLAILRCCGFCRLLRHSKLLLVAGFGFPFVPSLLLIVLLKNELRSDTFYSILDYYSAWFCLIISGTIVVLSIILLIVQHKFARSDSRLCVHSLLTTTEDVVPILDESPSYSQSTGFSAERNCNDVPDIEDTVIVKLPNSHETANSLSAPGAEDSDDLCTNNGYNDRLIADDSDVDNDESEGGSRQNLTTCPSSSTCSAEQRHRCKRALQKYRRRTETMVNEEFAGSDYQDYDDIDSYADLNAEELAKHSIFVALLCVSVVVNFFVSAWRVVKIDLNSGTYIQLKILDSVMTYGQSAICVLLFGTSRSVRYRLVKKFRKIFYGTEKLILPNDLDRPTKLVCDQFVRRHLTLCSNELCKNIRFVDLVAKQARLSRIKFLCVFVVSFFRIFAFSVMCSSINLFPLVLRESLGRNSLRVYRNVFRGTDFVDWLLQNALVEDRSSAVRYGRRLVLGKILEHVKQEEHFHDSKMIYRFCDRSLTNGGDDSQEA